MEKILSVFFSMIIFRPVLCGLAVSRSSTPTYSFDSDAFDPKRQHFFKKVKSCINAPNGVIVVQMGRLRNVRSD